MPANSLNVPSSALTEMPPSRICQTEPDAWRSGIATSGDRRASRWQYRNTAEMKFSVSQLLVVFIILAVAMGWWCDRRHLARKTATLYEEILALETLIEARDAYEEADLPRSKTLLDKGFTHWLALPDVNGGLDKRSDPHLLDAINLYQDVLMQLDEDIGHDFPFNHLIAANEDAQ